MTDTGDEMTREGFPVRRGSPWCLILRFSGTWDIRLFLFDDNFQEGGHPGFARAAALSPLRYRDSIQVHMRHVPLLILRISRLEPRSAVVGTTRDYSQTCDMFVSGAKVGAL